MVVRTERETDNRRRVAGAAQTNKELAEWHRIQRKN